MYNYKKERCPLSGNSASWLSWRCLCLDRRWTWLFMLLGLRSLDDYFRVSQFFDSVLLGTTLFDNVCWLPLLPWAVVVDLLVLTCKQSLFYFSTSKQMMVNGSDHLCSVSGSWFYLDFFSVQSLNEWTGSSYTVFNQPKGFVLWQNFLKVQGFLNISICTVKHFNTFKRLVPLLMAVEISTCMVYHCVSISGSCFDCCTSNIDWLINNSTVKNNIALLVLQLCIWLLAKWEFFAFCKSLPVSPNAASFLLSGVLSNLRWCTSKTSLNAALQTFMYVYKLVPTYRVILSLDSECW